MTDGVRTWAIGDVHGCKTALETLVERLAPRRSDTLILLGDLVNRGPDTAGVLEWVAAYGEPARLVVLRGNHDVMMLEARENRAAADEWVASGGDETLASYAARQPEIEERTVKMQLAAIPDRHWAVLEQTLPYWETDEAIYVHAVPDPALPMEQQSDDRLYWEKLHDFPPPHCSGKPVVCGHTAQKSGRPKANEHWVCVDTDCARGGWLTAYEVASGSLVQADESGRTRTLPPRPVAVTTRPA